MIDDTVLLLNCIGLWLKWQILLTPSCDARVGELGRQTSAGL